jgi:hypothetical protein
LQKEHKTTMTLPSFPTRLPTQHALVKEQRAHDRVGLHLFLPSWSLFRMLHLVRATGLACEIERDAIGAKGCPEAQG